MIIASSDSMTQSHNVSTARPNSLASRNSSKHGAGRVTSFRRRKRHPERAIQHSDQPKCHGDWNLPCLKMQQSRRENWPASGYGGSGW